MSKKSFLLKALERWIRDDGNLDVILGLDNRGPVRNAQEAYGICAALDVLRDEPDRLGDIELHTPLATLAGLFMEIEGEDAARVLLEEGLPRLRPWIRDALDGRELHEEDLMLLLMILANYGLREDVDLIAEAARHPIAPEHPMWSIVLGAFDPGHEFAAEMVDALRDPLPPAFIRVAYLDMATGLAMAGRLKRHPFDSESGRAQLEEWLRDPDEESFSYAHSATAALPFLAAAHREKLLPLAAGHPDPAVRRESAWARARSGDPAGVQELAKLCTDVRHSTVARGYLEDLGHADAIPKEALEPDFMALAEMVNWLADPHEFGRPPDAVEVYDTRRLYWPPTDDERQLWLVKYTYEEGEDGEPESGVGLVGSETFVFFDELPEDAPPEDFYGVHCCWELELIDDPRAPEEISAKAGRKLLRRQNPGF